ncbi:conjugal transfer protein TraD [Sphingomonas cavernae]|uniref:Conjugal transfer protein TraD n=1 Tax=Sphingomonas cavernae TaxID=2320861 RepID=A0A418WPQ5_9SPHN|nr:conjugal transfer protein TraD [Sphingomonas cavernae]RJF86117.1 conjugal transfer protein TraD [Sphingomonas cavernae]RJF93194.1 conjugal transfer protein TraD [Sphingomonas cavernae]
MRRPRDFDSELKALADKTRALKERRVRELGALVMACGADVLDIDLLAGALLDAANCDDMIRREEWRRSGAGFFQRTRGNARGARRGPQGSEAGTGDAISPAGRTGAA